MKRFSICLFLSLLLATPLLAGQSSLSFKRLESEIEFPGGTVQDTLQDSQGFMWFGTRGGLVRFDGHAFKVFRTVPNNPTSISDNRVLGLLEDKQGFLWVSTFHGLNRFNPSTEEFVRYFHDKADPKSLTSNIVFRLLQDRNENIWVSTLNAGINRYNPTDDSFIHYRHSDSDIDGLNHDSIFSLYEDKIGTLWVATKKGLARYEQSSDRFVRHQLEGNDRAELNSLIINDVIEGSEGNLWISSYKGVFKLSKSNTSFVNYPLENLEGNKKKERNIPTEFLLDSSGKLWVASIAGLNLLDREQNKFVRFGHKPNDVHSLSDNSVVSLYEDKSGEIWIGVRGGGLNVLNKRGRNLSYFRHEPTDSKSISNNQISAILETQNKNLWIGTLNGLNRYVSSKDHFVSYFKNDNEKHGLIDNEINELLEDRKGRLWVGSDYGLQRYNEELDGFIHYLPNPFPSNPQSNTNNYVLSLLEDLSGNIWVGTYRGLYQFDTITEKFVHYTHDKNDPTSLSGKNVTKLLLDKNGIIWAGTDNQGLNKFDPKRKSFVHYRHSPTDFNSLTHDSIRALFEDSDGKLWVGTSVGLSRFDSKSNKFEHFEEFSGTGISLILADQNNFIWVGTNKGLSRFNPKTESFKNYDSSSVLHNQGFFNGITLSSGELILGGTDGLLRFDPSQLKESLIAPDIVLTDFLLFNQSVPIGKKADSEVDFKPKATSNRTRTSFVLENAINKTKELTLTHEENVFAFEFSALHYANSKKNQYAYKLEGLDKEWIYTDYKNRRATYTSIPSGDYTLRVKASNSDGVWNETGTSIELTILPPPWLSWWAYTIYITVALSLFLLVATLAYKRKIAEKEKLAALSISSAKENLFANISHEFRTPLTLILGPSASIKQETNDQKIKSNVSLIERNAKRLLNMVDQVLDLAKLQGTKDQAKTNQGVSEIVEFLVHSFQSLVEEKEIELSIDYSVKDDLFVSMVPDALTKILTNLLSNAFKYTPPGGKVIIKVDRDSHHNVLLSIRDTGCGISPEDQSTIFERFTRLQKTEDSVSGTGIGLALVKQLVESHEGTITVNSQLEVGSEFIVSLPLVEDLQDKPEAMSQTSTSYINEMVENINIEQPPEAQHENRSDTPQHNNPLVLIIEDNKDMRDFIKNAIKNDYQVITASEGEAGVKLAIERVPDLIISDVMMPKMDGYEVARTLKSNHITSHIPLVLLTAKGDNQSRIRGWQENVDEYLTKPFDSEELLIRMNSLLSIRELLRERFNQQRQSVQPVSLTKMDGLEEESEDWISAEQKFMERYNQVLNEHFSEPNLKVGSIAQALHMTERQLSRKIKSLLNSTPSSYLRNFRLEKASNLLKQGKNIGEVAFSVGFSSHSNFGRYFKAKYGVSPKEYRTQSS
jgi:ligand-binding sensor domain-containing protein/signal transduction histidine kinase/CheY-like chemotaxis protein